MSSMQISAAGRRWGRRVGRRFRKMDRFEWQARGLGWLEGAGMVTSPIVAIAVWQAYGDKPIAVVVAVVLALVTSCIAHEHYPELKKERRAELAAEYERGYIQAVRDERNEAEQRAEEALS